MIDNWTTVLFIILLVVVVWFLMQFQREAKEAEQKAAGNDPSLQPEEEKETESKALTKEDEIGDTEGQPLQEKTTPPVVTTDSNPVTEEAFSEEEGECTEEETVTEECESGEGENLQQEEEPVKEILVEPELPQSEIPPKSGEENVTAEGKQQGTEDVKDEKKSIATEEEREISSNTNEEKFKKLRGITSDGKTIVVDSKKK